MVHGDPKAGLMHAVIFLGFLSLLARKVQLLAIGYDEHTSALPGLAGGLFALGKDGVEVAVLDVRSGLGSTRFYEGCGYVEVGRVPGVIRVAPGDDRDSVVMARRLDGHPMVADGRA